MGFAWAEFLKGAGSAIERCTPSRTARLSPTAASGRARRVGTPHPLDPAPRSEQPFAHEFAAGSGTGDCNPNRIELQVPIVPGRPEPLVASTTPIPTGIPACAWGTPSGPVAEPTGETP